MLDRVRGLSLDFPIGEQTVRKRVSARAMEIIVSLRTDDDSEARKRQAAIISYLENVYRGLRDDRPAEITHREAVALAGEFYRRWAEEREGDGECNTRVSRNLRRISYLRDTLLMRCDHRHPRMPSHWAFLAKTLTLTVSPSCNAKASRTLFSIPHSMATLLKR